LDLPTCEIDADYHVLIPSRFPPVRLYERLGPPEVQERATALEQLTNPRLKARAKLEESDPGLPSSSPKLQNWNHAPFEYPNPEGTTFLGPAYKVLELVAGEWAALRRAILRREAFLARTDEPAIDFDMRLITRRVRGRFVDLTSQPSLRDEHDRHKLGQDLYEGGAAGIAFRWGVDNSVLAVSVFDPSALGRAVQGDHYRFVWDGEVVSVVGNFRTHEVFERRDLFGAAA
jgi:hypothetical protein